MRITMHAKRCRILAAVLLVVSSMAHVVANHHLFEDLRKMPMLKGIPKEEANRLGKATSDSWVELAPLRQLPNYSYRVSASYHNGEWYSTQIGISMGSPESRQANTLAEEVAGGEKFFVEIRDILVAAWGPAEMYMVTEEDRGESGAPTQRVSWMDEENVISISRNPYSGHLGILLEPIAAYTDDIFEPSDSWRELFARKIKTHAGKLPVDWREIDLGVPAPDGAPSGDTSHAPPAVGEQPGRQNAVGRSETDPGDAGPFIPDSSTLSSTTEKGASTLAMWAASTVGLVTALGFMIWLARARKVRNGSKNNGSG